jgi:hypothetical protein
VIADAPDPGFRVPYMAKTYYFYGHEGSEQNNAPHPEAHEQTVALITSSGSELVFQTHRDLGGVTYQIGAAGTVAIHDADADKPTVVFGPHARFSVMGDVHPDGHGS